MARSAADAPPDLSGLLDLARDRRLDMKPVLLRVQTDLFRAAPVRDVATIRAFESLACGLIPTVDSATAEIVAQKLAPLADTPQSVLTLLAAHGGGARDAVLALSPVLSTALLDAAGNGPELDAVIALRHDLGRALVDDLSQRDEPDVDLALARNATAPLAGAALVRLAERARRRPDLAALLLARDDLPAVELAPLYLKADGERRAAIRDGVAARAALRPQGRAGTRAAVAALTAFAARGEPERFEAALGEALGMPGAGLRASEPERRDLLALALRAADLAEDEAVVMFRHLDPAAARSAEAESGLTELFRVMDAATARDLVASILGSDGILHGATPEQHRPAHGPASPRLRPAAAPSLRPALPERTRKAR